MSDGHDSRRPPISGRTALVTIIGHPIAQVRSPTTLNAELQRAGIDAVLLPLDLAPPALPAFLASLRDWRNSPGCIVTVPHKIPSAALVDELTTRATLLGAVNLIRRTSDGRLIGDMIDGLGFMAALKGSAFDARGKSVVVFGAGAVGRALLVSLAEAGARRIVFHDPDEARRRALRDLAAKAGVADRVETEGELDLGGFDLAVNATPVGMRGNERMAFDPALLPVSALVADVVTDPAETLLLKAARARGLRTQNGLAMSDAQVFMQMAHFGLGDTR